MLELMVKMKKSQDASKKTEQRREKEENIDWGETGTAKPNTRQQEPEFSGTIDFRGLCKEGETYTTDRTILVLFHQMKTKF